MLGTVNGQGGYGILGYRSITSSPELLNFLKNNGFSTAYSINNNSFVTGVGYQWKHDDWKRPYNNFIPITMLYTNMDFNSFDYTGAFDNDYNEINFDWNVGGGYGFRLSNGFTVSANVEYTFLTGLDGTFESIPTENYFSLNFKVGFGKTTDLGHLGLYGTHSPNRHFINKSGPSLISNEITVEIPITIYYWGVAILSVLGGASADDVFPSSSPSSIPSSSSKRGCHVFGKIRFVDFGEDYKVRFVNFGEDVKIKYVDFGANSDGKWQVVNFGEDYKIRVVKFGEDFKAREVSFGEGCN